MYTVCMSFLSCAVDHSRVILKVPDESGCDYINASYINVSTHVGMHDHKPKKVYDCVLN